MTTVAKTLRIPEEEERRLEKLKQFRDEPTESSLLRRIFTKGLRDELADVAIDIYQENRDQVTLREVADDFEIAPSILYHRCFDRGIPIFEVDQEEMNREIQEGYVRLQKREED